MTDTPASADMTEPGDKLTVAHFTLLDDAYKHRDHSEECARYWGSVSARYWPHLRALASARAERAIAPIPSAILKALDDYDHLINVLEGKAEQEWSSDYSYARGILERAKAALIATPPVAKTCTYPDCECTDEHGFCPPQAAETGKTGYCSLGDGCNCGVESSTRTISEYAKCPHWRWDEAPPAAETGGGQDDVKMDWPNNVIKRGDETYRVAYPDDADARGRELVEDMREVAQVLATPDGPNDEGLPEFARLVSGAANWIEARLRSNRR